MAAVRTDMSVGGHGHVRGVACGGWFEGMAADFVCFAWEYLGLVRCWRCSSPRLWAGSTVEMGDWQERSHMSEMSVVVRVLHGAEAATEHCAGCSGAS